MRVLPALLALAAVLGLSACSHNKKTEVSIPEGASLNGLRRFGVLAFGDGKGKGAAIADSVEAALRQQFYEVAERKPIERAITQHKPDKDFGLSAEVFEMVRQNTGADAIIQGRMVPDWSAAVVVIYETELGDPVMHAILRPRGKGHKTFETPDEIAAELVRALNDRR